jgi:hypothetical protein
MTTGTSRHAQGRAQQERLRALGEQSDATLSRSLDGGWTIAAKLAHLAYWEGRQIGALEAWQRHGVPPAWWTLEEADAVNAARQQHWLALPPRTAVELAIATAEALDRVMESLPVDVIAQLPRRRQIPSAHRGDHLDEIDRVLARRQRTRSSGSKQRTTQPGALEAAAGVPGGGT